MSNPLFPKRYIPPAGEEPVASAYVSIREQADSVGRIVEGLPDELRIELAPSGVDPDDARKDRVNEWVRSHVRFWTGVRP